MKVIVENTVCLNAGDAAILIAIMRIIGRTLGKDVEFHVFDKNPAVAAKYYKDIRFYPLTTSLLKTEPFNLPLVGKRWNIRIRRNVQRLKNWRYNRILKSLAAGQLSKLAQFTSFDRQLSKNLKTYSDADLVVSTGGTYLVEHYDIAPCIEEFEKDFILRKPLVLFTQSLGPFTRPENVEKVREIASKARLILLRDEKSQNNLLNIGVSGDRLRVVSDSVFALADTDALKEPFAGVKGERMRVAVSVRDWQHFENLDAEVGMRNYKKSVADAVTSLVRQRRCEVVFLSTCQGIPEYRYDDSAVAMEIFESLDADTKKSVSVDRAFHSPDELMTLVRGFDFVISTRMHMAILSMCSGVPVLPISYEFKMTELYRGISQSKWVTDISHIVPEEFTRKAIQFSGELEGFYRSVMPEIAAQALSAQSAGPLALGAIKESHPVRAMRS
ncbi:colanic acid/amylovoran biosynthesis protein [Rhizobium sp. BK049]|uniref:polysaccharide pyruvyl transferase family protein n=1 Tax=Rhizobium sp. BK049 TaxID=2587095 RepID=UPI0016130B86|nr:polysaccharide pyruvyl transferase family protein [Rhizobium sp. BK049]MBB3351024.1 colanic acid/amylovoran biosynthesis protein [Rhizobium sp. BK049]